MGGKKGKNFDDMGDGLNFGGDEFFPFDDKYLDSMSDGGDDFGMPKDMPNKKGIKGFFKNVVKSTKGLTMDIAKAQVPNVVDFGSSLKETVKAGRDDVAQMRLKAGETAGKLFGARTGEGSKDTKTIVKETKTKLKDGLKEIGSRLKSGEFYRTADENMEMGDMFGDGGDFGGGGASGSTTVTSSPVTELSSEPFGETSTSQSSKTYARSSGGKGRGGVAIVKDSRAGVAATIAAAETTNKTAGAVGMATINTMNSIYAKQFEVDESRFRMHMKYQESILGNLSIITNYVNKIGTSATAADMEYKTKQMAMIQDQNMILKDIKAALYYTSPQYAQYEQSKLTKILGGGGGLNGGEYWKNIKSNAGMALGSSSIGTLMEMGGMYADMKGSMNDMGMKQKFDPMSMIMRAGTNALLSKGTKQKLSNINDIFSNAGGLMIGKMNQISRFSNNPIISGIANMLGVKDSYVKKADLGLKDPNAKAIFDMKTHRSINEVIPGYLAKILAATSGQEETFYDYKTGSYRTATSLKKQMNRNIDRAYESSYELNSMTKAMSGHAIKSDKRIKKLNPAEVEKDFETIKRNIVKLNITFDQDTISHLFRDQKLTEQLTDGTKYKEASLQAFKNAFMQLNVEEQLMFQSQIAKIYGNVADAYKQNNRDLQQNGGASIYSSEANAQEIEELKRNLKYSSYADASTSKKGTSAERTKWERRKKTLEEIERLGGGDQVGYIKAAHDNDSGEINTTSTAGIWSSIHNLLLNGIIVYPKMVNTLPKHLAKAQSAQAAIQAEAKQRKADQDYELEARSQEIKQLQENMVKRAFQMKAVRAVGLTDALRLRGQRFATTNGVNQGVNSGANSFISGVGHLINGKNAQYGAGLGVMNNAYEDAYDVLGEGARSEMSVLGTIARTNKDSGGIRGATGRGADRLNNYLNNRRSKANHDTVELNPDGSLKHSKEGRMKKSYSKKKKELVDYLANKGIFDKIDSTTRKLFGAVDALSDDEIDKIIQEQREKDLSDIVTDTQASQSPAFQSANTVVGGAVARKRKISRVTNNYNSDNTGVVAGITTTNDLLSQYLNKEASVSADLMNGTNNRLDVITTQMATVLALMSGGSGDKDVKAVSDSMVNKIGKVKDRGKNFFKKIFTGFHSSTKRITDKFKKSEKEETEAKKKHGLLAGLLGFGGAAIGLGGKMVGGALGLGGRIAGKAPGAVSFASGVAGGAVSFGGKMLKGVSNFLFGKKEDIKKFGKEVHSAIKIIQKEIKGLSLKERIKIIEDHVKEGDITKRAGSFIIAKLKDANKRKIDLDGAISGLKGSLKDTFAKGKESGKGFIQKSVNNLQAMLNKRKSENVNIPSGKKRGGLLGTIGGAVSGAVSGIFGGIKGLFGGKKDGGKDDAREGSYQDEKNDDDTALKLKQAADNAKHLKLIYQDVHKIKIKLVGKDKNPFGDAFGNLFGGAAGAAGIKGLFGGNQGGGILDDAGNLIMNEVGDKVTDKIGGKIFGRLGKSKLGRKFASKFGKKVAEEVGEKAALRVGKKAAMKVGEKALIKGGAKLGGKAAGHALSGALSGTGVGIPIAAAIELAFAAADGVGGWKHANEIADVEEGQKATTGQKIGSAASGVASGLTLGLVDPKAIYGAGKKFGNYLVGDKADANGNMVKRSTFEKNIRKAAMITPFTAGGMFAIDAIKSGFSKNKKKISKLITPVIGRISSPFGARLDPFGSGETVVHNGLDIAAPVGTPIKAINDGTVYKVGTNHPVFGKFAVIKHDNGVTTIHGHASQLEVKKGDKVVQGQEIAKVGSTGESTGPHIHFTVLKGDKIVNPANFIKSNGSDVKDSVPVTSFYSDITGVTKGSSAKAAPSDKGDLKSMPLNPDATSPEEYPNGVNSSDITSNGGFVKSNSTTTITSSYTSGQEQTSPNLRHKNTGSIKESPIVTGARGGQGGSEEINASIELTRKLLAEQTRHNKVSEQFYKAVQIILETMNDREEDQFKEHVKNVEKKKRAALENRMSSSTGMSSKSSRNNNEYGINDYDDIATGY